MLCAGSCMIVRFGLLPCCAAPTLRCSMRLSGLACCLAVMRHSALMHEAAKQSQLLGSAHSILLLQALLTMSACDGGQLLRQPPWDKQPLQTMSRSTRLPLPQVSHVITNAAPQLSVLPEGGLLLSVNGALMCQCLAARDPSFKHISVLVTPWWLVPLWLTIHLAEYPCIMLMLHH